MKKRTLCSLMLAVVSLTACATNPPKKPEPRYVYMLLFGGKARAYPKSIPTDEEKTVMADALAGYFCLPPDDWKAQENYNLETENRR